MPKLSDFSPEIQRQIAPQLGHTTPEVGESVFDEVAAQGTEIATLHKPFMSWLDSRGILYLRARSDKKSTISKGWPDFSIFTTTGKALFVEFKSRGGRPSQEQLDIAEKLVAFGFPLLVTKSLKEAQQFILERMA